MTLENNARVGSATQQGDGESGPTAPWPDIVWKPVSAAPLPADVRHDVRHAASTILLLVATLRADEHDEPTHSAYDAIAHCARSIATLVRDGALPAPEPLDVDVVALEAVRRTGLLFDGTLDVDVEPVQVLGSNLDISRLLANLLDNSCRAAGRSGTVQLGVKTDGAWCRISVGDSGDGFAENPTSKGMGLSAITAIAVRLTGYVTFGRSPLGGALVTAHLPRLGDDDGATALQGGRS